LTLFAAARYGRSELVDVPKPGQHEESRTARRETDGGNPDSFVSFKARLAQDASSNSLVLGLVP
jgi:hypothetical protein